MSGMRTTPTGSLFRSRLTVTVLATDWSEADNLIGNLLDHEQVTLGTWTTVEVLEHVLDFITDEGDGEGWRVICSCAWESWANASEEEARAQLRTHQLLSEDEES